jgi:hypothetical protein
MLRFFNTLCLVALLMGLGVRVSGVHFDCCPPKTHDAACCDGHDETALNEHGPECPPFHHDHDHHHGACCTALVWGVTKHAEFVVFPAWQSTPRGPNSHEYPPDGPVLPLDKPPLI